MTSPMTRDQIDRLRALAETARSSNGASHWFTPLSASEHGFVEACSPSVVLSLLDALDASRRDAERWEEWASHQEGCPWCAEAHPRDCGDGSLLWARCHPDDEEAARILNERDPASHTPEPAHE